MAGLGWIFIGFLILWLLFALRNVFKWVLIILLFMGGGLISKVVQAVLFIPFLLWSLVTDHLFRVRYQKGGGFVLMAKLLLIAGGIGGVVYLIRK